MTLKLSSCSSKARNIGVCTSQGQLKTLVSLLNKWITVSNSVLQSQIGLQKLDYPLASDLPKSMLYGWVKLSWGNLFHKKDKLVKLMTYFIASVGWKHLLSSRLICNYCIHVHTRLLIVNWVGFTFPQSAQTDLCVLTPIKNMSVRIKNMLNKLNCNCKHNMLKL